MSTTNLKVAHCQVPIFSGRAIVLCENNQRSELKCNIRDLLTGHCFAVRDESRHVFRGILLCSSSRLLLPSMSVDTAVLDDVVNNTSSCTTT
jgi:hypothetical protein